MSDPVRLADGDASSFEATLLRSWEGERPDPAARDRVLAALGVAGVPAAVTAAATAHGATHAAASIAPKAGGLVISLTTKMIVASALVLGGAYGVSRVLHARAPEAPAAVANGAEAPARPKTTLAPPTTSSPVSSPVTSTPPNTNATSVSVSDLPVADTHVASPAAHRTESAPSATPPMALAEQVAELDRARALLDAGDAARAESAAAACARRFPDGALRQEAELVRIDAIARQGDMDRAGRAAQSFLAKYPGSPHAAHVRSLVR